MNALKKAKSTSKPLRKMKPFARWTVKGKRVCFDGDVFGYSSGAREAREIAAKLNEYGATLKVRP